MPLPPSKVRKHGSPLPSQKSVGEFDQLSLADLATLINEHHHAVRHHALLVGRALLHARDRVTKDSPGGWTKWLKANFAGSPETARVYMRVADNWPLLVEAGKGESTLEEMRAFIRDLAATKRVEKREAESAASDPVKASSEPAESTAADNTASEPDSTVEESGSDSDPIRKPPAGDKEAKLLFDGETEAREYDSLVERSMEFLGTRKSKDAVMEALRLFVEVKCPCA